MANDLNHNPAEFRALFRAHARFVWRLARHLGADERSLDDTVQEVFFVVFRRLHEFLYKADIKTWLYAITWRVVHGQRRSSRREKLGMSGFEEYRARGTAEPYSRQEAAHELMHVLGILNEEERAIYVFSQLYGRTAKDIGELLDVNQHTVSSRLGAARRKLARHLGLAANERAIVVEPTQPEVP